MNFNKVIVAGNLTRDPELRQTPTGQSVCTIGVATNRIYTDAAGQKQTQADFHNVVLWGRLAEISNQYLKKGMLVLIEGRLQTRSWQDQQGTRHNRTEIVAERMQMGPRGSASASQTDSFSAGKSDTHEPATPIIDLETEDEGLNIKDIPF